MSKHRMTAWCAGAVIALGIWFAPCATPAAPSMVLRLGDEGAAIQMLQQKLKDMGYFKNEKTTTYFGIVTQQSISSFQKQNGLTQDGVAGEQTLKLIFGEEYDAYADQYAQTVITQSEELTAAGSGARQYSESVMKLGDQNDDVTKLQNRLKELGFFTGDATGFFGAKTQNAVLAFQADRDLNQDGTVGAMTLSALYEEQAAPTERKFSLDTLIPGDESEEVKNLQYRLQELGYYSYNVTGFFGPITTESLRAFQKNNNLTIDGLAGKSTRNKLFAAGAIPASATPAQAALPAETPVSQTSVTRSADGELTAANVVEYARQFLGVPYVYAANGPDAFDCTGFTTYVFKQFGIDYLPRSARDQGYNDYAPKVENAGDLMPGDLVFFNTTSSSGLSNHAGIYIGDGQFIHATSGSSKQVIISPLDSGYYQRVFSWGRRVIG